MYRFTFIYFTLTKFPSYKPNKESLVFICTIMQLTISKKITEGLNIVRQIYHSRGFTMTDFYGDNEFEINALQRALAPEKLHIHTKK